MNLQDKLIWKRGRGVDSKAVQRLKWARILNRKDNKVSFVIAKGYNHHNEAQSRVGKPNIHFKFVGKPMK